MSWCTSCIWDCETGSPPTRDDGMAQQDKLTITKAAIARLADCGDPRFKEVMTALIRHLHDFVREVDLSEAEWAKAIGFLTDTGQKCDERRQEFILLSDT